MPTYKISYFFEQRKNGWSETFYADADVIATARTAAQEMVPFRVPLLGGTVGDGSSPHMTEIRISNVAIQRDSLITRLSAADGNPPNPLGTADNPNLAILLRLQSGDLYRRQMYLRGNPDSLVQANGIYVSNPIWQGLFDRWAARQVNIGFGLLAVTRPPEIPLSLIAGVVFPPPIGVNILTTAPHGLVDQDSVRIVRCPGVTGIQGNWVVRVVDATTFELLGATGAGRYTGGGQWYKRTFATKKFSEIDIIGATHRITGRPFDSPRGRRRRKVRASSH